MKILHLISQYPSKTGSGIYLTEVYKNFKSMNFTQKVLCAMNEDDIIKVNFDDYEIIKFKSKDLSFPESYRDHQLSGPCCGDSARSSQTGKKHASCSGTEQKDWRILKRTASG